MSINVNDKENTSIYFTSPLFLPCTIEDPNFLGVYSSTSTLPTAPNNFNTAGVAGTGSMYVYLNNAWQYIGQYLYDAYRYLVYYQGSAFALASGTKWTSIFNDLVSNSSLMTEFAGNSTAMTNLAASSTAMNIIIASSTAMSTVTSSSTAMNAIAISSTAMNIITGSYTAMNAMTTLAAKNAFQSASSQLSYIQTLISKINSGTIVLGGGRAGSSSALGLNALLVLLSYDNGAAVPAGNASSSPTPTLASKMYSAYSPTQNSYSPGSNSSTSAVTLATNQIVFAVGGYGTSAGYSAGMGNVSGYSTTGTNASNILYTTAQSVTFPNEGVSPLLLSGSLYVCTSYTIDYYYLTYTPS